MWDTVDDAPETSLPAASCSRPVNTDMIWPKPLFPRSVAWRSAPAFSVAAAVLTIYVASDPDTYHRGLMHLFPHSARSRAGEVLSVMAATLRRWLRT